MSNKKAECTLSNLLPKDIVELIRSMEMVGYRPYSDTKAILDAATKRTVEALSGDQKLQN